MTALPTRKLEAWRYTDLRELSALEFADSPAFSGPVNLPKIDVPKLVFLNGVFAAEYSDVVPFRTDFTPATGGETLPLASINAARAHDGAVLEIPAGTDAGTVVIYARTQGVELVSSHSGNRISLGEGASLTLIEVADGDGLYWMNTLFDIDLAKDAKLTHYRIQNDSVSAYSTTTIRAEVAESAHYHQISGVFGAKLSRTEVHVALRGTQAHADLSGVQLLRGRQHGDFTYVMRHDAENCTSRQNVKNVLADQARGVFQGRIEVARHAQKTDGYQMSRALLLSPDAEMDIKPELEIFADDVKCSHGATIGALDENQVFYLRSRGIEEAQAKSILIRAFLDEALEPIDDLAVRILFEAAIETWWSRS